MGGGAEGERILADSVLSMKPNLGLNITALRSYNEPKSRVEHLLTAPPRYKNIKDDDQIYNVLKEVYKYKIFERV